jgi:hypothetical protein
VGGLTESEHAPLEALLTRLEGARCTVEVAEPLAHDRAPTGLKRIGYGVPILVRYRISDASGGDRVAQAVFRTQAPNWFGHDRRSDRACLSLLACDTYGAQPRHIEVRDVGAIRGDELVSLRDAGEFYLVTSYVEGSLYADDLRRVSEMGHATVGDLARARALARHLAELHTPIDGGREIYVRAVRDLVGSGEGIFGIVDSYPAEFERKDLLRAIEHLSVDWRARLVDQHAGALCRTHGDFHPYNVLFREGVDFTLLDASRGGAGDAADDVAAMLINYLFHGMRTPDAWATGFGALFRSFVAEYGADEVFERIPPFFAWRSLVLASPAWYPDVAPEIRHALLESAVAWLDGAPFDPASIDASMLGGGRPLAGLAHRRALPESGRKQEPSAPGPTSQRSREAKLP